MHVRDPVVAAGLLKAAGHTTTSLASIVRKGDGTPVSHTLISLVLRGKRSTSPETAASIASTIGVLPHLLFVDRSAIGRGSGPDAQPVPATRRAATTERTRP